MVAHYVKEFGAWWKVLVVVNLGFFDPDNLLLKSSTIVTEYGYISFEFGLLIFKLVLRN